MDFSQRLAEVNEQLHLVKLRAKGDRLYLRGTFPPKPGEGSKPKRYEIASGCTATAAGLRIAKAKAQEIESQLMLERFDWGTWGRPQQQEFETCGTWIERFEVAYWDARPKNLDTANSFKKNYRNHFKFLPADQPLTTELLQHVLKTSIAPEQRSREIRYRAFQALANFAGLDCDLSPLKGCYATEAIDPRNLPSEDKILEVWHSIRNPGWKWIYAVMATYGVRNHEAFFLDTSRLIEEPAVVTVLRGKTGRRLVYPYPQQWVELMNIREVRKPRTKVEGVSNNTLGCKVSGFFHDRGLPFRPYDLRHAYAIRTAIYGLDVAIAAKLMGHSVKVHCQKYHAFLDERHLAEAYLRSQRNQPVLRLSGGILRNSPQAMRLTCQEGEELTSPIAR